MSKKEPVLHPCSKCGHSLVRHTNGTYIAEGKCMDCNCNIPRSGVVNNGNNR